MTRLDFCKSHFQGPKYSKKVVLPAIESNVMAYGRGNSGGSWLPEDKKDNMWHGRENSAWLVTLRNM